jgi:hypothetical protein
MIENEEFFRTENGKRLRVVKTAEIYSDKTQKVREQVYDTEADQRLLDQKIYQLDAAGKRIEESGQIEQEKLAGVQYQQQQQQAQQQQ